jgi:hypothetical protein
MQVARHLGGLAVLLAVSVSCASAPAPPRWADIEKVVNAFYGGISAGDEKAAVFIESAKIETQAEYEANHLPADIEFETHVKPVRGPLKVTFHGSDAAWVISRAEYDEGNPEKYIITQLRC